MSKMHRCLRERIVPAAVMVLVMATVAFPAGDAPTPGPDDKCPVCGMFVHRYPDFVTSVTYADGRSVFFDGAKDMFKYLLNHSRYAPERSRDDIAFIRVTEYYDLASIDARKAYYVIGSDVLGPMGRELIPLRTAEDARLFSKDHAGRRVLTFEAITPAVIRQLD